MPVRNDFNISETIGASGREINDICGRIDSFGARFDSLGARFESKGKRSSSFIRLGLPGMFAPLPRIYDLSTLYAESLMNWRRSTRMLGPGGGSTADCIR